MTTRYCTCWGRDCLGIDWSQRHKLIVGTFHWLPDNLMKPKDDFESVILDVVHKFKNTPNCTWIFGSDFNAGVIDWDFNTVHEHYQNKQINKWIANLISDSGFIQIQTELTRNDKISDTLCTNKLGLFRGIYSNRGISDHSIIQMWPYNL